MTEMTPALESFINNVKLSQVVWGLQDESGEGWVVCDSSEYEATDVMPLWSEEAQAKSHCTDEWERLHSGCNYLRRIPRVLG